MNDLIREIIRAELEERFADRPVTRADLTPIFVKFARAMLPPAFDVEVWPGKEPNSLVARLIPRTKKK